jgi:resuscitation-promoting factor RpfB
VRTRLTISVVLLAATVLPAAPCAAAPVRVTMCVDGASRVVTGDTEEAIGDLVARCHVRLGPLDRVYPRRWGEVYEGLEVHVIRVHRDEVVAEETVPYPIQFREDPGLAWKSVRIESPNWSDGRYRRQLRIYYRNDNVEERVVLNEVTLVPCVPKVFVVGVQGRPAERPPWCDAEQIMDATGYSSEEPGMGTETSLGLRAGRGIIAVDPTVIPYGTRMWVEGYGWGVAGDCGGAIRGDRIDLCFDRLGEAQSYGRRRVRVRFAW